jgi:hypothetical protein
MNNQQTTPSPAEISDSLKELSPHKIVLGGDFELAIEYYANEDNLILSFAGTPLLRAMEVSKNLLISAANDGARSKLYCVTPGLEVEFAAFLALTIERIRLGTSPREAIISQLDSWRTLTAGPEQVDIRGATGLFGELWFALSITRLGAEIDAWSALSGSVFDFSLNNIEIEVKTTTRSAHIHRISRPDQLVESIGSNSWLLSIMVARVGNSSGTSIGDMMQKLSECGWNKDRMEAHVKGLNLGPYNKVLEHAFKLRELPMWVPGLVLPLVTPQNLLALIGPEVVRLSQFEYNIDVTGLGATSPFGDLLLSEDDK